MPLRRCAGSSAQASPASTRGCARSRPDRTALRRKPSCAGTSAASLRPSGGSTARPASTLSCAGKGTGMRDGGSSGSCATWVCKPNVVGDASPKPRTAAMTSRWRQTCSAAPLWPSDPTPCGWPTSPTFQLTRAFYTSRPSKIWPRARSWAGRWRITSRPACVSTPWSWLSSAASPRGGSFIIATAGCNLGSSGRRNTLREEVAMAVRKRRSDRSGRGALPSPGLPSVARREDRHQFWVLIAAGRSSEDAAVGAGVSPAVGGRWFRRGGRVGPGGGRPSRRHISRGRETARRLERAPSTISRELRRNAATRSGGLEYRATTAQGHADRSARRPKPARLASTEPLRRYVQDRLAGLIMAPNGAAVHGPVVPWKGRRHGRRQDRRWATAWSPEQIARRLRLDFPDDETMRISHEAIYQALYVQGRGALRRDLLPAHRAGLAGAAGAQPRTGQIRYRPRDPDQPTPGGGGRSGGAGPLGGGPHRGVGQLGDRHPGGAHDAVHDPAPPAPHGGPR